MIDILTARPGDLVVYGPYLCSEGLENERFIGIYQGFMYWSPDERLIELWVNLIGVSEHNQGMKISVRASQVTRIFLASEVQV